MCIRLVLWCRLLITTAVAAVTEEHTANTIIRLLGSARFGENFVAADNLVSGEMTEKRTK
ncbi:unnamed protein product [Nippostrongylus brasiliensis]|uniref:Secreted protein n=1 Tax=Nippostrongylus brasiliensis TaxID=27835 RepID=A0A0N4YPI9_NIPBR|nr:unnamed protein product [Nippostrongylus brasiliensis]